MEFETTHPWLNFRLNMEGAGPRLWMSLGEAQSKCIHIAGVPLRPQTAEKLYKIYLAKGVHATTAIEGNTLSEDDVLRRIEHGKQLELLPSQEYLDKEIRNIIDVCNELKQNINQTGFGNLNRKQIEEFNKRVLNDLPLEEGVVPGKVRNYSVGVASYRGAPHAECEYLLDRLCEWLNSADFVPANDGDKISYGIIKAIVAHVYLAWIHAFGDGNGRTARIIEFYILMASGVPAPATQLLSNHYNRTRAEYYRQLSKASAVHNGDLLPFIGYAVQGLVDGLKGQLDWIKGQQLAVTWENLVHASFKGKDGPTAERQRNLILDLSEKTDPVPLNKIPEISPRMAIAYARKTTKTIRRDVNAILKMDPVLLVNTAEGLIANKGIIFAFLPARHVGDGEPDETVSL